MSTDQHQRKQRPTGKSGSYWSKGITISLIAFAGMLAFFAWKAANNPSPLVTENYYEQELKYQQRINETNSANALGSHVKINLTTNRLTLTFPEEVHGLPITGQLTLLRPNNPSLDKKFNFQADNSGVYQIAMNDLPKGRYNALLEWHAEGVAYYTEEKLVVQ